MLQTTRGIVFQQIKYSESSLIVKVFTEELGLQSLIVKGVRSKKSKTKPALFQPLNLLNLVIDHKEGRSLQYIREISISRVYHTIPVDIVKRSILFFLSELLTRSIREETQDKTLFEWLFNALTWLDLSENPNLNFHLIFMIQLSRPLGFYPKKQNVDNDSIFDLREGLFTGSMPQHPDFIRGEPVRILNMLHASTFEDGDKIEMSNTERRQLLDTLIYYYRLHLPGFGEMKSAEVLKSVLG